MRIGNEHIAKFLEDANEGMGPVRQWGSFKKGSPGFRSLFSAESGASLGMKIGRGAGIAAMGAPSVFAGYNAIKSIRDRHFMRTVLWGGASVGAAFGMQKLMASEKAATFGKGLMDSMLGQMRSTPGV